MNKNRCRICLGTYNLLDIFEDSDTIDKIIFCASVQISKDDSLPAKICKQCTFYLDIAYVFKTVCESTDTKLREELDNSLQSTVDLITDADSVCDGKKIIVVTSLIPDVFDYVDSMQEEYLEKNEEVTTVELAEKDTIIEETTCNSDDNKLDYTEQIETNENSVDLEEFLIINEKQKDGQDIHVDKTFIIESCSHEEFFAVMDEAADEKRSDRTGKSDDTDGSIGHEINCDIDTHHNIEDVPQYFEQFKSNVEEEVKISKVGRHIAKKNSGQPPKRYSPDVILPKFKLVNDAKKDDPKLENDITDEELQKKTNKNMFEEGQILESDLSMPDPIFEETIITEGIEEKDDFNLNQDVILTDPPVQSPDERAEKLNLRKKSRKFYQHKKKLKMLKAPIKAQRGGKKINIFLDQTMISRKVKYRNKLKKSSTANHPQATVENEEDKKHNFTCNSCSKSFPFRSHLLRHINTHTGVKNFSCDHCDKQFINSYNLTVHLRTHTGNFPLKCDRCNRGFSSPSVLKRHLRSHTGETPYRCKYCLKLFAHASSLHLHEKMHVQKPSYTCDICFKVFSYTNSLVAHKKTHSGYKAHSCNVCYKSFTRNTSLKRHMRSHSTFKKIKCRLCGETFVSSTSFTTHVKMHSKHKCETCDLIFTSKSLLSLHSKKHKETFKCDLCSKKFTNRALLIKHLQKHIIGDPNG